MQQATTVSAQAAFVVPDGYKRLEPSRNCDSPLWAHGVRIENVINPKDGAFFCMVGKCLEIEGAHGNLGKKIEVKHCTSNANQHLQQVHGIVGPRTKKYKQSKSDELESKTKKARVKEHMNQDRYWALTLALVIIRFMYPFSHVESDQHR